MKLLFLIVIIILLVVVVFLLLNNQTSSKFMEKALYNVNPQTLFIIQYLNLLSTNVKQIRKQFPYYYRLYLESIEQNIHNIVSNIETGTPDINLITENIKQSMDSLYKAYFQISLLNYRKYNKYLICNFLTTVYKNYIVYKGNSLTADQLAMLQYYIEKIQYEIYFGFDQVVLLQNINSFMSFLKNNL